MSKRNKRLEKLSVIAEMKYTVEAQKMSEVLARRRELERHLRALSAAGHGKIETEDLALGAKAQSLWKVKQSQQKAALQDDLARTRALQERLRGPLSTAFGRKEVLGRLPRD